MPVSGGVCEYAKIFSSPLPSATYLPSYRFWYVFIFYITECSKGYFAGVKDIFSKVSYILRSYFINPFCYLFYINYSVEIYLIPGEFCHPALACLKTEEHASLELFFCRYQLFFTHLFFCKCIEFFKN